MIRIGQSSIASGGSAAATATLLWLGFASPANAVDEFPTSKDCKPIPYCVTYQKGEAGQFAGRCIRWAQILPCTPTPAPVESEQPVKPDAVQKPPVGFNPTNKSNAEVVPKPKADVLGQPKPSQESLPPGGTGNFLKQMKP